MNFATWWSSCHGSGARGRRRHRCIYLSICHALLFLLHTRLDALHVSGPSSRKEHLRKKTGARYVVRELQCTLRPSSPRHTEAPTAVLSKINVLFDHIGGGGTPRGLAPELMPSDRLGGGAMTR